MIETSRNLGRWRSAVAAAARAERVELTDGDIELRIVALWRRPASHYRSNGTLKPRAPDRPRYADCDKVCRSICDALAGIAYANDRQVAALSIERRWAVGDESDGAWISVRPAVPSGCWIFAPQG